MSDTARSPFAEPAQSPVPPEHPAPPPPAGATPAPVRRLHPFTLLLQMAALLPQFLYIIPALFFGMYQGGKMAFIAPALLVFFLLSIGFSWLAWHRFTYQVGAEELRITSGIMNRNARSIPYARIQDVSIEQKLLARLLGLATVKLETGSGGGDDGVLNAVSLTEAGRLRDIIRARKSDAAPAPGDAAVESPGAVPAGEPEPAPLFAMDSRRVLIAGIFNFSLVILAVLIAAAQNLDFLIPQEMFNPGYWIDRIDASGQHPHAQSVEPGRRPAGCDRQPGIRRPRHRHRAHVLSRIRLPARPHRQWSAAAARACDADRRGNAAAPDPGRVGYHRTGQAAFRVVPAQIPVRWQAMERTKTTTASRRSPRWTRSTVFWPSRASRASRAIRRSGTWSAATGGCPRSWLPRCCAA